MSEEMAHRVVEAVTRGRRYRSVDPALVERLAVEELPRARTPDEVVKRVKRRLHQAVGAYRVATRRPLEPIRAAWAGDPASAPFRAACRELLATHSSTRERLGELDAFYPRIWEAVGATPRSVLDLGCGLGPLALPWMGLASSAHLTAVDTDAALLAVVDGFLDLVGQPHATLQADLAAAVAPVLPPVEVAMLLKLVPILDRQDPAAAARLLGCLDAPAAVVSFPSRSLGGREKGMGRAYRRRAVELAAELGDRLIGLEEVDAPGELVFVLRLASPANHA